jgi:hypothetical protein
MSKDARRPIADLECPRPDLAQPEGVSQVMYKTSFVVLEIT